MRLPNSVVLLAQPCGHGREVDKPKARHWIAESDGVMVGEFKSWQVTTYIRISGADRYGRGDRKYKSVVVRESWLNSVPGESAEAPNTERSFIDWKLGCRALPMPGIKILRRAPGTEAMNEDWRKLLTSS